MCVSACTCARLPALVGLQPWFLSWLLPAGDAAPGLTFDLRAHRSGGLRAGCAALEFGGPVRLLVPLSLLLFISSDGMKTRKTEHLSA